MALHEHHWKLTYAVFSGTNHILTNWFNYYLFNNKHSNFNYAFVICCEPHICRGPLTQCCVHMLSPFPGVKISPLPCTPPIHECGSVMTTLVSHGVPVQQNMQLSRSFNVIKVKSTSRSFEVNSSRSFSHQISWLYHPEHHNVFTRSPP